jgi:hypothetical protein
MRKAVRAIEYMPYGIIQQQIMLQQKKICVDVVFIPVQNYYFFDKMAKIFMSMTISCNFFLFEWLFILYFA